MVVRLLAEDARFDSTPYLITPIVRRWRADGIEVVIVRGTEPCTDPAVVLPHFDVTVTPAPYQAALDTAPVVLNRGVVDIAKRAIHPDLILAADDDYTGRVIVKTDRNYGGLPEVRLRASVTPPLRRVASRVWSRLARGRPRAVDWSRVETMSPDAYRVYASLRDVPPAVFGNAHLVVEKLVTEETGGDYCVRYYYCLGNREFQIRLRSSTTAVVKGAAAHACDEIAAIPDGIRAIRRRLGLDYGKLDYVLRADEVTLLDVNRTPAHAILDRFGLTEKVARHLADGIHAAANSPGR